MKLPKTKTTLLWQTALRDIRACRATPLHDEDIVWLWQLADRVYRPTGSERYRAFTRAPYLAGNCWFYRITLQGLMWLSSLDSWWKGADILPAAYACAHSDGSECPAFAETDCTTIARAVCDWADGLDCSMDQLRLAVRIQTGLPDQQVEVDPGSENLDATEWGQILALLSGAYHIAPWELIMRPWHDIEDMLAQLPKLAALYGNIANDAAGKATLHEFQTAILFLKKGGTSEPADATRSANATEPESAAAPVPVTSTPPAVPVSQPEQAARPQTTTPVSSTSSQLHSSTP